MGSQKARKKPDVVFVHSQSKKTGALRVVRAREDRIELGEMRQPKDGERIDGELVKLTQRKEHERLFDVEPAQPQEESAAPAPRDGPAQVATDSYRQNWDEVFGGKRKSKPKQPKYLH